VCCGRKSFINGFFRMGCKWDLLDTTVWKHHALRLNSQYTRPPRHRRVTAASPPRWWKPGASESDQQYIRDDQQSVQVGFKQIQTDSRAESRVSISDNLWDSEHLTLTSNNWPTLKIWLSFFFPEVLFQFVTFTPSAWTSTQRCRPLSLQIWLISF